MSKSVAIVTGASQGIGQATAIRLARDFSALVLVARNRANLEQTAEAVRAAGAEALIIDVDLAQPSAAQTVVDQTLQAFGRIDALLNIAGAVPQIDLFEMTDEQWEAGLALEAARRTPPHHRCLAGAEAGEGLGGADVRQFGGLPEGALRRGRHDQRGDYRAGQGLLRSGNRGRRPGKQRAAGTGHDRSPPLLSGALGSAPRDDVSRRPRPGSRRRPASPATASPRRSPN